MPELLCTIATSKVAGEVDLAPFDGAYLGQPFCPRVEGNLLTNKDSLRRAIARLHDAGKRAYLSTLVVPSTKDMQMVEAAIEIAASEGIDGVEAHDMGVFRLLRRRFPQLKVHVGHFANVYHIETARVLAALGASRILPSYELTMEEKRTFVSGGVELEVPVGGKIPIGMAHACLLRLSFPSRTEMPCRQQCAERRELLFSDKSWKMRCAGTAMVMAEDLVMIEHLGTLLADGYDAFRLETFLEPADKISQLGKVYRAALEGAAAGRPFERRHLETVTALAEGGICNGWYFGASGRAFVESVLGDDPAGQFAEQISG